MDDTTNNITQSIMSPPSSENMLSVTSTENGFFSRLKDINITTWIIIILILAFLGFNIFIYLAQGTQFLTDFLEPLFKKVFGITIGTTSQVVDVSAEGAKEVVKQTAEVIDAGLSSVQDATPNTIQSKTTIRGDTLNQKPKVDIKQQDALNKALSSTKPEQKQENDYQSDYASSSIQGGGKAGWCYIGEDRGFRTCAEVGVNDTCMSGNIFPSQEICMNPNLRT